MESHTSLLTLITSSACYQDQPGVNSRGEGASLIIVNIKC